MSVVRGNEARTRAAICAPESEREREREDYARCRGNGVRGVSREESEKGTEILYERAREFAGISKVPSYRDLFPPRDVCQSGRLPNN